MVCSTTKRLKLVLIYSRRDFLTSGPAARDERRFTAAVCAKTETYDNKQRAEGSEQAATSDRAVGFKPLLYVFVL